MSHRPPSESSSPPSSPTSASSQERLILVPDDQFENDALLGLWPDDDEAPAERERSNSIPPQNAPALPPRAIIPLLIGPCTKLGTTYIPRAVEIAGPVPALIGLVGMALLSAFTGQVWVLLGRYVSRWTIEEIVAEAIIRNPGRRGSHKDKWKRRIRKSSRVLVCTTALLLCAMYLHESAHLLQPALPIDTTYASQAGTTVILAAVLMPLVSASSLATRQVLWSNFLSIVLQLVIAIVGAVHYFHGQDETSHAGPTKRGLPKLPHSHTEAGTWEAISILSFAFANHLLTLPVYSALVTNFAAKPTFAPRPRTRRMITSFPMLSLVATAASIALTLPLILAPLTRHAAPPDPGFVPTIVLGPIQETVSKKLEAAIPTIQAFALILTIPLLFAGVIVPRVRQRSYRWFLFLFATFVAAVIPGRKAGLTGLAMTLSLFTCYVLPAFLHAVFHGLRRPRSILFTGPAAVAASTGPEPSSSADDPEALLRHKERSLQRRRLARRVLWDVGVWVVLGPVGSAAAVWTAGRAVGVW
ncbi:Transmembrane amino acid transporter protein [Ceratobasidium sp. AG-Ba]|nr:Transmembrane amino acid transporter protein [Ceratobasidium sp. AG-Ba]